MPSSVLKVDFDRIPMWMAVKEIKKFSQKAMRTTDVKTLDCGRHGLKVKSHGQVDETVDRSMW